MAKKSTGSLHGLRDRCVSDAVAYGKKAHWTDKLPPKFAAELSDVVQEWVDGGEIRRLYPSKRSLTLWLQSLPEIPVGRNSLENYIDSKARSHGS